MNYGFQNKLEQLAPEFKKVLEAASELTGPGGFKIYLVGGIVRDLILGRDIFDLDIVVEGDAIALVRELAGRLNCELKKHPAFGTATLYFADKTIDFATARSEQYPRWGDLPRVEPADLTADLKRRDFTINAIALSLNHPGYATLIDLHGGIPDLKKGLIRILHKKSFLEDPTRILRCIRFEQRFGFRIETVTLQLLREAVDRQAFSSVSSYRLRNELTLISKEVDAYRCIERINNLAGYSFLEGLLSVKMHRPLKTKEDRVEEASRIFKELKRRPGKRLSRGKSVSGEKG